MLTRDPTCSSFAIITAAVLGLLLAEPCISQMEDGQTLGTIIDFIENLSEQILKGSEINYISDFEQIEQVQVALKNTYVETVLREYCGEAYCDKFLNVKFLKYINQLKNGSYYCEFTG